MRTCAISVSYTHLIQSIPGLLILAVIAFVGMLLSKYIPGGIPAAAWVVTLGCILTIPGVPGSDIVNGYVKNVGFVALCTPKMCIRDRINTPRPEISLFT